jgi:spore coat protein H
MVWGARDEGRIAGWELAKSRMRKALRLIAISIAAHGCGSEIVTGGDGSFSVQCADWAWWCVDTIVTDGAAPPVLTSDGAVGPGDEHAPTTPGDGGAEVQSRDDAATTRADGSLETFAGLRRPDDEAEYLFDPAIVRTYDVQIDPADLLKIDSDPKAEEWVPASLVFEGMTYGPFKVRYKGYAGSFEAPCLQKGVKGSRCSLKMGFDEVDGDARFFGLKKLNLHAEIPDDSLLRERLGYTLFRAHGLAAPRAMHARVLINGQLEGLFTVVEQVDGRFTRARFIEGGQGNVYKELWPVGQTQESALKALETNKSDVPSTQGFLNFQVAVSRGEAESSGFLDRAYLARYLAVDRVIINDDGALRFYCNESAGAPHNFYWYQESLSPRFWLIPWDLDNAFNNDRAFSSIDPAWYEPAE